MYKLFDFQCEKCGLVFERIVGDGEKPACPECHMPAKKLMSASNFNMGPCGAYGYYDENLGKYISTNKQRKEEMRKQGVTPAGETPKPNGGAWF
jgi:putative FmdB family regulatory protein